jgi:8-oxo-dGTP pyrophosphatase MutT (NUDIX family)
LVGDGKMQGERVDESNPWTVIREDVKHDCPHFTTRRDIVSFSGRAPRPYDSIRAKLHGVCIAPIDSAGYVTLVGQFRYVQGRYTWELPGGGWASDPLDAAKRELQEETGQHARNWLKVIDGAVSIGTSNETTPGFVAWGITAGEARPEPEERIALRREPFRRAVDMALQGEIAHLIGSALLLAIDARLRRDDLPRDLRDLLAQT